MTEQERERLRGLHCDCCAHHCSLLAPSCKNGMRRAKEALAQPEAVAVREVRERVVYDSLDDYLAALDRGEV